MVVAIATCPQAGQPPVWAEPDRPRVPPEADQGGQLMVALDEGFASVIVAVIGTVGALLAAGFASGTRKQTRPNGGTSMRDVLDRLESSAREHSTITRELAADMRDVRAEVRSIHERIGRIEAKETT